MAFSVSTSKVSLNWSCLQLATFKKSCTAVFKAEISDSDNFPCFPKTEKACVNLSTSCVVI